MSSTSRTGAAPDPTATEPIATHVRRDDEDATNAVVAAFSEEPLGGVPADGDPLYQWIDADSIDLVLESARADAAFSTIIWDHPVVFTSDAVEVYAQSETGI